MLKSGADFAHMHVAFVVPRFYPCVGGYENSILAVARRLRDSGHRVSVFTTTALDLEAFWVDGFRTVPAGTEAYDGVEITRFPICYRRWLRRLGRVAALTPNWSLKARFARPSFRVIGLRQALKQCAADIIHVGPLPYNSLIYEGIYAARRQGARVIATPCVHFGIDGADEIARDYAAPHQIALLAQCDAVLTMTKMEARRLRELGLAAERLAVAPFPVPVSEVTGGSGENFRQRHGITEPIVLHLGMKAYDKGSVTVVEAMQKLWQQGNRAQLVLAGPSLAAFDDYLRVHASGCKRLLNLPPITAEERRDILAAADIVVQPSRVESLGLALLEGWANGKPVIAANIAVSRELVENNRNGRLVPFGDAEALAGAIGELLDNPDLGMAMAERGREQVVKVYASEPALARIENLITNSGPIVGAADRAGAV
jgi:glycosyltransferase involved in cell wall biosynthesis